MQCYSDLSPKREPMEVGYVHMEPELMPARRLELPAPPGKEFRAPVLLGPPAMPQQHSVIQCMRPPPPPPQHHPPRLHKPPMPSMFEEPTSSIPDLGDTGEQWDFTQPLSGHDETVPIIGEPCPEATSEPTPVHQDEPLPAPVPPPAPLDPVQISDDSSFPPLEPEVLSALGEATDQGPTWGEDIHSNLTQLWQPLLTKGMPKDNKDKILKQYLIPSNCTLLQAPKLNIEISAAVVEMIRLRDKKVETNQQQLGIGITAISKAMTSLLTSDCKIEAIKTLSDGCRILCDLHHSESQARIKMITPGLAKPFLNVIQDSVRDETLFGASLPDKIKASKTIEKQGLQIKKTAPPARPNPAAAQSTAQARQPYQGNWSGPPRYPTNRGGRGGQRKYPSSTRRTTSTSTTPASAQPRANYNRSRAPARS